MAVLLAGLVWALLVGWLILRAVRQFRAHAALSLDRPKAEPIAQQQAAVAIIVPVRNEAQNIKKCLAGLSALRGLAVGSSVTVVDDGSQDATADMVARKRVRCPPAG